MVSTTYYVRAEGDCNNTNAVSRLVTVRVPSTAPTGINLTNDNTCPGTSKVLTVVGGSLGDGAAWYWYSDASLTTLAGTGASITVDPLVSTTYYVRAEGDCNNTNAVSRLVTVLVASTDPTGINLTNDNTCTGTSKVLTLVGGSLGDGASWEWYTDAGFTASAGSGISITVDPLVSTTYYVRAEGDCNNTNAVSRLVTVRVPSTDPTGINLTNDNTCSGTSKVLTVVGGNLGDGASWEWYTDAGFTASAGSGISITVDPLVSTTYYVRAEGDCNTTTGISVLVTVSISSVDPTGVTVLNDGTCVGTGKILTIVEGSLGNNASWEWYSDAGFTVSVGSGPSITIDPDTSATYYVRAEGDCNTTTGISVDVTVSTSSTDPTGVTVLNDNTCFGTGKELTVIGGILGVNATWEWYSDATFSTSAGSGSSIIVDPVSTSTYFVRAEGTCNTTNSIEQQVIVKLPSIAPDEASVNIGEFCEGEVDEIILTYTGGLLGDGAVANWYTDSNLTGPVVATGNNITISAPTDTTIYYVRFEGDCDTTEAVSVQIIVNPMAMPVITGQSEVCEPDEVDYMVTGFEGSLFTWSVTGGTIMGDAFGESITVIWTGEGAGTINVTETTTGGCIGTFNSDVAKYLSPVAFEIESKGGVICKGEEGVVYHINGLENSVFEWTVEEGTITDDIGDSILVDWDVPKGSYHVWVVETTEHGCSGDTLSLMVQVEAPDLEMGEDPYICDGDMYTIDFSGEFNSYLWSDGSTDESYSTSEEGWIGLTAGDMHNCFVSDSIYLSVHALPVVDLGIDIYLCGDAGLILDAGDDGTVYSWSTGDRSQEITIYQGDRQVISVIVEDEYGCISMDTIVVDECNAEYYFRDIPTAITPNGDGVNDLWNIEKLAAYTQAEVEIYDRWGTLVWKSEPGYSEPWNGKNKNGNEVPMDSYHFVITLNIGSKDRITGIITVIK